MSNSSSLAGRIAGERRAAAARWAPSPALLCGVVLALSFAAYAETLTFQFVHDDRGQIVDNPAVHSWASVPQYFTAPVWAGVSPEELGNYYRPVFLLWLRLNDAVFGMRPWAWHLTTVLVHLGVTLLVYFLALRVLGDFHSAAFAALVFGLHPVHIEGVTWISGVTEPLLALFLISSFLCYLRQREAPGKAAAWRAASLVLYVLGMLEKETGLILPLIIFAYAWFSAAKQKEQPSVANYLRRMRGALGSALPYLVPVPFYLWARIHALKGFSHLLTPLPLSTVVCTWPAFMWFWIKHLVWPVGLSTFYDLPSVTHPDFWNFTMPAIGAVAVALGLVWGAMRFPEIAFASVWLLLPLIPLLDIRVFQRDDFAHDRYLYLPSVGFAIIAAVILRHLRLGRVQFAGVPAAQFVAILLVAVAMVFGTAYQSLYFRNNLVFYEHNLLSAPNSRIPKTNLASVLGEAGNYSVAIRLYQQALERDPGFWFANYNLGYTYYRIGRLDEAQRYLTKAIQINPNKPDEHLYLGLTLLRMGRLDEAATAIRHAIEIRPGAPGYHFSLGVVLKLQGNLQGALEEFKAEIAVNPQPAAARQQIAEIQATLNHPRSNKSTEP